MAARSWDASVRAEILDVWSALVSAIRAGDVDRATNLLRTHHDDGKLACHAKICLDQISNECNRLIAVYLLIWIKRCSRGLSVVAPSIDFCQRNNLNRDDLTNVTTARCDCRKTIRR